MISRFSYQAEWVFLCLVFTGRRRVNKATCRAA